MIDDGFWILFLVMAEESLQLMRQKHIAGSTSNLDYSAFWSILLSRELVARRIYIRVAQSGR